MQILDIKYNIHKIDNAIPITNIRRLKKFDEKLSSLLKIIKRRHCKNISFFHRYSIDTKYI